MSSESSMARLSSLTWRSLKLLYSPHWYCFQQVSNHFSRANSIRISSSASSHLPWYPPDGMADVAHSEGILVDVVARAGQH
jgi:hypothetical protein